MEGLVTNTSMIVKYGSKEGEFFPSKCKKSGKNIAQCIKYNSRWMNPIEFESLGGKQGKKWKET